MAQQIGAALGLAVFTTLAVSAANGQMPGAPEALQEGVARGDAAVIASAAGALTFGYTTAFLAGAVLLLIAAIIAVAAVTTDERKARRCPVPGLDLWCRPGGRSAERPPGYSRSVGTDLLLARRIGFQVLAPRCHGDRSL
jgi:hypothetical protein